MFFPSDLEGEYQVQAVKLKWDCTICVSDRPEVEKVELHFDVEETGVYFVVASSYRCVSLANKQM